MRGFHFSLWVFHRDFLLSVTILVMGCFLTTFLVTKIATSQALADLLTGKTAWGSRKRARASSKARQEILMAMNHHVDSIRGDRSIFDLEQWELAHVKEVREFYFDQIKEINIKEGFYGPKA